MATALLHSLAVTERRGIFKSWTVLLAISGFSLSLLGTFLTRSPVLVSVHAFASDPTRGLFILGLLGLFSGGALLLYALRAKNFESEGGFKLVSREAFLLGNNILLVIAAIGVLFGTLYPLFIDALGLGKISVGPPYFNAMFLVPMLPLAVLLGVGMHSFWKTMPGDTLLQRLIWPAGIALVVGIVVPLVVFNGLSVLTAIASVIGFWVCASALLEPLRKWVLRRGGPPLTRAQMGMYLAHFGVGIFILGATMVSAYNVETDVPARPGDHFQVGGYEIVFRTVRSVDGPNFTAEEGEFELRKSGETVSVVTSQQRLYRVQQSPMTEAAIDTRIGRDVFIALGEPLGDNAWSVRIQVKPLIRFLWLGSLLMALGGLLAITDRRYRLPVREGAAVTTGGARPVTETN
jgi:cytochrome c-type biogenesis protein CcmF